MQIQFVTKHNTIKAEKISFKLLIGFIQVQFSPHSWVKTVQYSSIVVSVDLISFVKFHLPVMKHSFLHIDY